MTSVTTLVVDRGGSPLSVAMRAMDQLPEAEGVPVNCIELGSKTIPDGRPTAATLTFWPESGSVSFVYSRGLVQGLDEARDPILELLVKWLPAKLAMIKRSTKTSHLFRGPTPLGDQDVSRCAQQASNSLQARFGCGQRNWFRRSVKNTSPLSRASRSFWHRQGAGMVEVATKAAFMHSLLQIAVARRNQARVGLQRLQAPNDSTEPSSGVAAKAAVGRLHKGAKSVRSFSGEPCAFGRQKRQRENVFCEEAARGAGAAALIVEVARFA
jgi:hypothetical protein